MLSQDRPQDETWFTILFSPYVTFTLDYNEEVTKTDLQNLSHDTLNNLARALDALCLAINVDVYYLKFSFMLKADSFFHLGTENLIQYAYVYEKERWIQNILSNSLAYYSSRKRTSFLFSHYSSNRFCSKDVNWWVGFRTFLTCQIYWEKETSVGCFSFQLPQHSECSNGTSEIKISFPPPEHALNHWAILRWLHDNLLYSLWWKMEILITPVQLLLSLFFLLCFS